MSRYNKDSYLDYNGSTEVLILIMEGEVNIKLQLIKVKHHLSLSLCIIQTAGITPLTVNNLGIEHIRLICLVAEYISNSLVEEANGQPGAHKERILLHLPYVFW